MAGQAAMRRLGRRARRAISFACGGLLLSLVAACDRPAASTGNDAAPIVFVAIPPQAFFVERIAGPYARVEFLAGPGQSPHTYEPTPQQMGRLAKARLYFEIGLGFEDRVLKQIRSANAKCEIVDTRIGVPLLAMTADDDDDHNHAAGAHGDHEHEAGAPDPHIWLDPKRVKIQARTIETALARAMPEHRAEFEKNLSAFERELDELDAELTQTLAPLKGQELYVYHPAYGYFADSYGLKQVAIETEGKEPSPRQLRQILERARGAGTRALFYQPQFARTTIDTMARELGVIPVPLDELSHDYFANMRGMAQTIRKALAEKRP